MIYLPNSDYYGSKTIQEHELVQSLTRFFVHESRLQVLDSLNFMVLMLKFVYKDNLHTLTRDLLIQGIEQ